MQSEDKIWKILSEKEVFSCKIFKINEMQCFLPSKNINNNFLSLKLHNWVNIFAYTKEKNVILVRQHRLGANIITNEVPAGAIEQNEDPEKAAKRELEEETSYTSNEIILDPFAGSGTCARAARNLNRRFILVEQNEEYFDKIVETLK